MKSYLERIPSFIFSLQQKEMVEMTQETLHLTPEEIFLESDRICDLSIQEDDTVSEGDQDDREIDRDTKLPIYSMEEVSYHDSFDDCWMILYDKVYDVTTFLQEHPGGEDVLMEYAGRDATISFRSVGHSTAALKAMDKYIMGILPDRQRLFPSDSQTRWSIV